MIPHPELVEDLTQFHVNVEKEKEEHWAMTRGSLNVCLPFFHHPTTAVEGDEPLEHSASQSQPPQ